MGEADAAVHSNPTLHRMRPDQPALQETRIRIPRKDAKGCQGRKARDDCPSTCHGAPPGRFRHRRSITAPHGPATRNREVSHPMSTRTRAGPRPSPRGKKNQVNRPSELNACLGPIMPRTRSSRLDHSLLKTTWPSRHMISRPSRPTTTRPPRLMTARPSRLRLGPAIPITRSSRPAMPITRSSSLKHLPG